jgi:L-2,4-diaminobutyrate transaminase
MARKSIADVFNDGGFTHGLTFGGHPVCTAAALANLDIMIEEDLPGKAKATGAYLRNQLETRFADHPHVGDIRGAGLFLGVEVVADKETKESWEYDAKVLQWMSDQMRSKGLILRNDGRGDPTTQICPPLVITNEEVDRAIDIMEEVFNGLARELGSIGTQHPMN